VHFCLDSSVHKTNISQVRADENPYTTEASRHHHRFSMNVCVGFLCNQLQELAALHNRLMGAAYHRFLVNDLTAALGTCDTSSQTTHVAHAFPSHSQTALQRDFRRTLDRTRRPRQLVCMVLGLTPLGLCLLGYLRLRCLQRRSKN
jgi:hypothetical protein